MKLIGLLMHLYYTLIPDIALLVNYLARFMQKPTRGLQTAGKHLLISLEGSSNLGLQFSSQDLQLKLELDLDQT